MSMSSLERELNEQVDRQLRKDKPILIERFIKRLVETGYPPEHLQLEWQNSNGPFDLAVIEPESNQLIAAFDFTTPAVSTQVISTSTEARERIKKCSELKGKKNIPIYKISLSRENSKFYQFVINIASPEEGHFVPISTVPPFHKLNKKILGGKIHKERDSLKRITALLLFLTIEILILNLFELMEISIETITILGIIIGLCLLPHAESLKFLNLQFTSKKDTKKKT